MFMFEITYPPFSLVKAILALLSINQGPYLSCRYVYNAYTLVVHTYKKVLVFRRRKSKVIYSTCLGKLREGEIREIEMIWNHVSDKLFF